MYYSTFFSTGKKKKSDVAQKSDVYIIVSRFLSLLSKERPTGWTEAFGTTAVSQKSENEEESNKLITHI